jgi:Methyltransferase domain
MTSPSPARTHPRFRPFEEVWAEVESFPGWLTPEQARRLWDCCADLPHGATVVEIGSYQGRSGSVMAAAVGPNGGRITAIDPFVGGLPRGVTGSQADFESNLERAGVRDVVDLLVCRSVEALPNWDGQIDMLYIDGKHDVLTVLRDLGWVRHVRPGRHVAIHDSFSSVGVTLGLFVGVLFRRRLRYLGRTGSLAVFRRERPTTASRLQMAAQLPWFARNLVIKILRRLRLDGPARALGHDQPADPF